MKAEPPKATIAVGQQGVTLNTIEAMYRFAQAVAASGWAPKGMEKPEAIVVAIQYGLEVGLTPMAALQNIAVINGRPSMYGDAQLALIRASGKCEHFSEALTDDASNLTFIELQFAIATEQDADIIAKLRLKLAVASAGIKFDKDDQGFSCCTRRQGGELEFSRFTIGQAKRADLWGKSGPWKQYPDRMLKFRARGFLLRDTYGDVLKGLIPFEEARDLVVAGTSRSVEELPLGRSSLRGPLNGHTDEQAQAGPSEEAYQKDDAPTITPEQDAEIGDLLLSKGLNITKWRADWERSHGGRLISSMTAAEADAEIKLLGQLESAGGGE